MPLLGLFKSRRYERAGFTLYREAVRAARTPWFYETAGVPDTLDGRFDMVGLYVALLVRRLRLAPKPGPQLAQAVFDAMFSDMDHNLREMGVGDMTVGKKVKAMWEAFNGRVRAYDAALHEGNEEGLAEAIRRNIWRGKADAGDPGLIARLALQQSAALAGIPLDRLQRGEVQLLPPGRVSA